MVEIPFAGTEDERSREIGWRAATNAYIALSALLLAIVVRHVVANGFTDIGAVGLEIAGFVLGWLIYFGTGLYYTRTM